MRAAGPTGSRLGTLGSRRMPLRHLSTHGPDNRTYALQVVSCTWLATALAFLCLCGKVAALERVHPCLAHTVTQVILGLGSICPYGRVDGAALTYVIWRYCVTSMLVPMLIMTHSLSGGIITEVR